MLAFVALSLAAAPEPRPTGDVGVGVVLGGGASVGFDVVWYPHPKLALDAAVGPRWGIGETLHLNVAGIVGGALELGNGHVRLGPFARIGATPPLTFTEAFVAGGVSTRIVPGKGVHLIAFDIGPGWFFVRDLPVVVHEQTNWPLYLRVSWNVMLR